MQHMDFRSVENKCKRRFGKMPDYEVSRYCHCTPVSKRIGVAKGKLKSPDDLDQYNDEIAAMFGGVL